MKVLAVDDEYGALKLLVKAIKTAEPDAQVTSFQYPEEAIVYARRNEIEVAFVDITMPEISGLEFAEMLKEINPEINIIFVTGYSDYTLDAINMRASGYVLKPVTASVISKELENLRYPVEKFEPCRIVFRTFGNFDLFIDGKVVTFSRKPAKELLAYLVDRKGATVSRKEIAAVLFEDRSYSRNTQSYITQIIKSLHATLKELDADDILIKEHNSYAIDTTKVDCDAYQYLAGREEAIKSFYGEYMAQYSWAEYTINQFEVR